MDETVGDAVAGTDDWWVIGNRAGNYLTLTRNGTFEYYTSTRDPESAVKFPSKASAVTEIGRITGLADWLVPLRLTKTVMTDR